MSQLRAGSQGRGGGFQRVPALADAPETTSLRSGVVNCPRLETQNYKLHCHWRDPRQISKPAFLLRQRLAPASSDPEPNPCLLFSSSLAMKAGTKKGVLSESPDGGGAKHRLNGLLGLSFLTQKRRGII